MLWSIPAIEIRISSGLVGHLAPTQTLPYVKADLQLRARVNLNCTTESAIHDSNGITITTNVNGLERFLIVESCCCSSAEFVTDTFFFHADYSPSHDKKRPGILFRC